jgi:resuscitation-promoting factor RpfB
MHPQYPSTPPDTWSMTPSYPTVEYPPAPLAQRSWWHRLHPLAKVASVAAAVLVVLCIGGIAIAAGGSPDASHTTAADPVDPAPLITSAAKSAPSESSPAESSPAESSPAAPATSKAPVLATPKVVMRTVTETVRIPFATKSVNDSSLPKGTSKVRTHGVAGVKTVTYQVTFTDGVQTSKKVLRQQVTKEPVTKVIAVGTKQTQKCDPNYSGACVPIASDVDCAGGGGNGPAYVQGPVRVIGTDIYDLDRDGDGIGCD